MKVSNPMKDKTKPFTPDEAVEFLRKHQLAGFITVGEEEYFAITKRGLDLAQKLAEIALAGALVGQSEVEILAEQAAECN